MPSTGSGSLSAARHTPPESCPFARRPPGAGRSEIAASPWRPPRRRRRPRAARGRDGSLARPARGRRQAAASAPSARQPARASRAIPAIAPGDTAGGLADQRGMRRASASARRRGAAPRRDRCAPRGSPRPRARSGRGTRWRGRSAAAGRGPSMMPCGVRSKCLRTRRSSSLVVERAGAEGVDANRDRLGDADRVGHLHLAAPREPRRHQVLGDPAHRVGGAAIDLRGILAREGAAAVAPHAAVGVDDDLAAGQARRRPSARRRRSGRSG